MKFAKNDARYKGFYDGVHGRPVDDGSVVTMYRHHYHAGYDEGRAKRRRLTEIKGLSEAEIQLWFKEWTDHVGEDAPASDEASGGELVGRRPAKKRPRGVRR